MIKPVYTVYYIISKYNISYEIKMSILRSLSD